MTTQKALANGGHSVPALPGHASVLAPGPDMLSVHEGRLSIDDVVASGLVERFGSPLFACSETQSRTDVRRFRGAMASAWPESPFDGATSRQGQVHVIRRPETQDDVRARAFVTEGLQAAYEYCGGAIDVGVKTNIQRGGHETCMQPAE